MEPAVLFKLANLIAMLGWVAMIILHDRPITYRLIFNGIILLLSLFYASAIAWSFSEPQGQGDFSSLEGVMALFKQATGMNPAFPAIKTKSKRLNTITYTTSLNKEIRTSLTKILFSNIDLNITVNEVPNTIGGYEFKFSIHYTHPDGHDNTYYIGSVNFVNNKLTPKFN
jgi:hypothetical protein